MEWWRRRMVGFDLETTSPLPEEARIVTASVAEVGGGEPTRAFDWLADPGVEIPEEASAVHGVTTERAREEGAPVRDVVEELVELLVGALARGWPLDIFNARYDLTVLDRECRRYGIEPLSARPVELLVVDPAVLDKWLDRYRKSYPGRMTPEQAAAAGVASSRTLGGMCEHYAAVYARRTGRPKPSLLVDAHQSAADAIAVARLAWLMAGAGEVVRRVRDRGEASEKAQLVRTWDRVKDDLPALHAFQSALAVEERGRFAEYKRSIGEHDVADRVEAECGWPVLDVMSHEEAMADG